MTKYVSKAIIKGLLLIASGLLVAFFPGVINKLFYIIGVLLIAASVISFILSLATGWVRVVGPALGIIIGIIVIALPSFVTVGIPLIAGIVFVSSAIERLIGTYRSYKWGVNWMFSAIIGVITLIVGGFLIFHPLKTSTIIRVVIGFIMIAVGSFNIFNDISLSKPDSKIIDVDSFTVSDDK